MSPVQMHQAARLLVVAQTVVVSELKFAWATSVARLEAFCADSIALFAAAKADLKSETPCWLPAGAF